MVTSTASVGSQTAAADTAQTDAGIKALARALKHKREEAQELVRLVESAMSGGKGQHVNYYG